MVDDSISVFAPGARITTGAVSASVAIPTDSSGAVPKYVRVATTAACCVRIGGAAVAATTSDTMVQPGDAVVLQTGHQSTIAAIQVSATGTCQISPLEDQ